ncbi:MAG: hypothetical protein ACFFB0_21990 [Promethearchaeota archaeon]
MKLKQNIRAFSEKNLLVRNTSPSFLIIPIEELIVPIGDFKRNSFKIIKDGSANC